MTEKKKWFEWVTGSLEEKKQYREHQERVKQLPAGYRETQKALERYLLYRGGHGSGQELLRMMTDLADLIEGAAADGTAIAEVIGEDPAEFAEEFLANYTDSQWITKEQDRLRKAVAEATTSQAEGAES
ncbi:DUF1048 domain-containing protein [Nesterenkonia sp. CL21]|uniref:DUF1048 domain-containing protein n=1 Tax=Nesterenkonia sp. CL21 TaxID=3064894 RepID=UPI00287A9080|nr:DUF1048 domain-containing protein [Nesterenkonia sp. CL21]MDS2172996.1 DUF1048 domain-containing protein [Nesterenkonia sp. CL21]